MTKSFFGRPLLKEGPGPAQYNKYPTFKNDQLNSRYGSMLRGTTNRFETTKIVSCKEYERDKISMHSPGVGYYRGLD